jgi:hypothetical protein
VGDTPRTNDFRLHIATGHDPQDALDEALLMIEHLEYELALANSRLAMLHSVKQDQKFNLRPIHDWHPAYKLPDDTKQEDNNDEPGILPGPSCAVAG